MDVSYKSPAELRAELGSRLRALRLRRNLMQREVAAKAGLSLSAVVKLEAGAGSTVDTLVRVLKALDAADAIATLAPEPRISPVALLRSPRPRRRASRPRGGSGAAP